MKLFYTDTNNSRPTCALAKHLKIPTEYVLVDLTKGQQKTPDFLSVNPNGKVPALSDGDVNLFEGPAIMVYQAQQSDSSMWPSEPMAQVEVVKWISWDKAHYSRYGSSLYFEYVIKDRFMMGEPDLNIVNESLEYWRKFSAVLNDHLTENRYLVGNQLTVADFVVATVLPWANECKLPLDEFNGLSGWYKEIEKLEAWRDPWPNI